MGLDGELDGETVLEAASAVVGDAVGTAPSTVKPIDEAKRKAQAERAKVQRRLKKLKAARTVEELERLASGRDEALPAPSEPAAAAVVVQAPVEPPLDWHKATREIFTTVAELIPLGVGLAHPLLKTQDEVAIADAVARGAAKALEGPAGDRLTEAWQPILERYAPRFLASPWFGAATGTVVAVGMMRKAIEAELEQLPQVRALREAQRAQEQAA